MTSTESPTVVVYRTRGCPFCVAAERLLREREIAFDQVYLDDHPDRRAFTDAILSGHRTVPLVVVDDEPLGGFTELQQLDARGELGARLGGGSRSS